MLIRIQTKRVLLLVLACAASVTSSSSAAVPEGQVEEFPAVVAGNPRGYPDGIVTGAESLLWYSDPYTGKIRRMSPAGEVTGEFLVPPGSLRSPPFETREPGPLALGADGNLWFTDYASDTEGFSSVGRITPTGDIEEFRLLQSYMEPEGIALGPDGNMWFTETRLQEGPSTSASSGAIARITPSGHISEYTVPDASQLGIPTLNLPEASQPGAIARGTGEKMWFIDNGYNSEGKSFVGEIDTKTDVISQFQIPSQGYVDSIVAGPDREMWFIEFYAAQIGRIAADGTISESRVPNATHYMNDIALGPDGNMWFTAYSSRGSTIARMTETGTVTSFPTSIENGRPVEIALGPDGSMWFTNPEAGMVGRFIVPFAPGSLQPPTISGQAEQGQALSVSDGDWSHAPSDFAYQWEDCDTSGGDCSPIYGELTARHLLTTADVGHTLRVHVEASNIGGTTSAMSSPSPTIGPPTPVLQAPEAQLPSISPSVVPSTLTWHFGWARKFTIVESLVGHSVPTGGVVEVTCTGHGCPFGRRRLTASAKVRACSGHRCQSGARKPRAGDVALTAMFKRRRLRVGTRIVVKFSKEGLGGKSFTFTVRYNHPPNVTIRCLGGGSAGPVGEC